MGFVKNNAAARFVTVYAVVWSLSSTDLMHLFVRCVCVMLVHLFPQRYVSVALGVGFTERPFNGFLHVFSTFGRRGPESDICNSYTTSYMVCLLQGAVYLGLLLLKKKRKRSIALKRSYTEHYFR